jgi:hypothetical protein
VVFRILPPLFRAKASAEGPCGKRALPENKATRSDNPTRSGFCGKKERKTNSETRVLRFCQGRVWRTGRW